MGSAYPPPKSWLVSGSRLLTGISAGMARLLSDPEIESADREVVSLSLPLSLPPSLSCSLSLPASSLSLPLSKCEPEIEGAARAVLRCEVCVCLCMSVCV
jgi:hypothetical protein